MDPITISALIGLGAQAVGAVVGELMSQGRKEEADGLIKQAASAYNVPQPQIEQFRDQLLGPSALSSIQTDPRLQQAQYHSLDKLREMEGGGGFTLEDQAALNKIQNQTAQGESASRARVLDQMRQRGAGGSGLEAQMLLANQQGQATRANEAGTNVAAAAQKRYLDSILQQGDMSGKMRSQDWSEKSRVAEAQDAISRYNAMARERGTMQRNAQAQQAYQNQVGVAGHQADIYKWLAQNALGQQGSDRQFANGIGQAVGYGSAAIGSYMNSQSPNNAGGGGGGYGITPDPMYGAAPGAPSSPPPYDPYDPLNDRQRYD